MVFFFLDYGIHINMNDHYHDVMYLTKLKARTHQEEGISFRCSASSDSDDYRCHVNDHSIYLFPLTNIRLA